MLYRFSAETICPVHLLKIQSAGAPNHVEAYSAIIDRVFHRPRRWTALIPVDSPSALGSGALSGRPSIHHIGLLGYGRRRKPEDLSTSHLHVPGSTRSYCGRLRKQNTGGVHAVATTGFTRPTGQFHPLTGRPHYLQIQGVPSRIHPTTARHHQCNVTLSPSAARPQRRRTITHAHRPPAQATTQVLHRGCRDCDRFLCGRQHSHGYLNWMFARWVNFLRIFTIHVTLLRQFRYSSCIHHIYRVC